MRVPAALAVCALLATPLTAGIFDDEDCRHTAARRVTAPAAGVSRVIIHAEAGSLTVAGTPGVTQIVASGTACTSDGDLIDRMTLAMRRAGSELHITAQIPDKAVFFGFFQAKLDFAVSVPTGMAVVIDDESGWIKASGLGPTEIDDDSGSIELRNVRGNVAIDDASGSIDVDSVIGNVRIDDDSGEIVVKNVNGEVVIEDESGSITVDRVEKSVRVAEDDSGSISIRNVKGDVLVEDDASGSVDVTDVGGRFTVGRKSSGSIDYARVAGKVSVPRED